MGRGIALVAVDVAKVQQVVLIDSNQNGLELAKKYISTKIDGNKTSSENDKTSAKKNISYSLSIDRGLLDSMDAIIEAVPEDFNLKKDVFTQLDKATSPECIFASNTSSISITKLGAVSRPALTVGMHFMNPVPVMPLVEVIPGLQTSSETVRAVDDLAKRMNKSTAQSKDTPGFVANRLLMPYINEAVEVLHQGVSSKEDIDKIMKLGTNMPMGPLKLADLIGLDTCLSIMQTLHSQLGEDKYRPSVLLRLMVDTKRLGRKTKSGFYDYKDE